jgi:hypothetical protein
VVTRNYQPPRVVRNNTEICTAIATTMESMMLCCYCPSSVKIE